MYLNTNRVTNTTAGLSENTAPKIQNTYYFNVHITISS